MSRGILIVKGSRTDVEGNLLITRARDMDALERLFCQCGLTFRRRGHDSAVIDGSHKHSAFIIPISVSFSSRVAKQLKKALVGLGLDVTLSSNSNERRPSTSTKDPAPKTKRRSNGHH